MDNIDLIHVKETSGDGYIFGVVLLLLYKGKKILLAVLNSSGLKMYDNCKQKAKPVLIPETKTSFQCLTLQWFVLG